MRVVEKVTYTVGGEHRELTKREKERLRDDFARAMGYQRVKTEDADKTEEK